MWVFYGDLIGLGLTPNHDNVRSAFKQIREVSGPPLSLSLSLSLSLFLSSSLPPCVLTVRIRINLLIEIEQFQPSALTTHQTFAGNFNKL